MEATSCERIVLTLGGSAVKEEEKLKTIELLHSRSINYSYSPYCPIFAAPIAMILASLVPASSL